MRIPLGNVRLHRVPHIHQRLRRQFSVIEPVQSLVLAFHDVSGLPWWATLGLSAVGVRVACLPVIYYQLHASSRLIKALPTLSYLNRLVIDAMRLLKPGDVAGRVAHLRNFAEGASAAMRVHDASILKAVSGPLVQVPAFAVFVLATRGLIADGGHGMDMEGVAWFLDLTSRDETLILPCLAVASTYLNLELSLGDPRLGPPKPLATPATAKETTLLLTDSSLAPAPPPLSPSPQAPSISLMLKDIVQTGLVIGLPLISTLPSGAFMYWITSSVFTAGQITLLRLGAVRKYLGLPPRNIIKP